MLSRKPTGEPSGPEAPERGEQVGDRRDQRDRGEHPLEPPAAPEPERRRRRPRAARNSGQRSPRRSSSAGPEELPPDVGVGDVVDDRVRVAALRAPPASSAGRCRRTGTGVPATIRSRDVPEAAAGEQARRPTPQRRAQRARRVAAIDDHADRERADRRDRRSASCRARARRRARRRSGARARSGPRALTRIATAASRSAIATTSLLALPGWRENSRSADISAATAAIAGAPAP